MSKENITRLSIDVPNDLHKVLKFYVLNHNTNIKDYVLGIIEEDLSEELEDYLLGQAATKSEKQGSLGIRKSKDLLKKLKKAK